MSVHDTVIINNRYRIIKELGIGGMGILYSVEDSFKDNMKFALKTIKTAVIKKYSRHGIDIFKNEYEIMTRLKHPNLTRVYDFGEDQNRYFIVMEYLEGQLLADCVSDSIKEILDIIVQILRALEYIHSRDIIYRDIKPGNIMIRDNLVKLMDFGLSNFIKRKEENIIGTPLYMAPETLCCQFGFSSDIFSTGIVLFELITRKRYYASPGPSADSLFELLSNMDKYNEFHQDRLGSINNESLIRIISKMTAYDKDSRYNVCSEIISDINDLFDLDYAIETKETRFSYVLGNGFADRHNELQILKKPH